MAKNKELMSILESNVQFLKSHAPGLLELIGRAGQKKANTIPAKNGSLTLVYHKDGTPYYLHSRFNPQEESQKILQKRNLEADHIVVLGLGLGYQLELLMNRKDPLTRVLLVEPDMELLGHSLKTVDWKHLFSRKDFFYCFGTDLDQLAETLHGFVNVTALDKLEFVELPAETRLLKPFFEKAREIVEAEIKAHLYDFKTRLAESYMVPRNIMKNLPLILKTRPITRLENAFKGVPGFIVSAGPSLDKNVLFLEKLRDRGIMVAVDTALKPLLKRSIQPHFTAIGDPSHKNYLHLQGCEEQLQHFVVAETGIAHQVFKDFPNKLFTLSIGKSLVRLLEKHSESLGEVDAWGSVISIAVAFAVYIGLDPIVFVGQDFAFSGTRNHCRGTSWEEHKMEYSRSLDELQRFEAQSIAGNKKVMEMEDIYGHKTHTSERLALYKNFLVRMTRRYPQTRFINATQGGIFSEIPHMTLYEVIRQHVYGREPIDTSALHHLPIFGTQKNIAGLKDYMNHIEAFFAGYLEQINEALAKIEEAEKMTPTEGLPLFHFLDETQQKLYKDLQYGEILEIWSTAPIYHYLREYKEIRGRQLDQATITKGLDIYRKYYRNLKPLARDIIKQFKITAKKL